MKCDDCGRNIEPRDFTDSVYFDVHLGDRGQVYLNGKEVADAVRGKTGEDGWVECLERPIRCAGGEIVTYTMKGQIRFDPKTDDWYREKSS